MYSCTKITVFWGMTQCDLVNINFNIIHSSTPNYSTRSLLDVMLSDDNFYVYLLPLSALSCVLVLPPPPVRILIVWGL